LYPGAKVLDVGSVSVDLSHLVLTLTNPFVHRQGSGYTAAIFHHLVSPGTFERQPVDPGKIVGIDHIPELVEWSLENLKKDGLEKALMNGEIMMVAGDGRKGTFHL
jgi:protein-L-isoaspartate(D-aspartate) O-methyltransferase